MQTKKTNKKLSLKKVSVSRLSDGTMDRLHGGVLGADALRTRYTACNYEERKAIVFTGFSSVDACVSKCPGCIEG